MKPPYEPYAQNKYKEIKLEQQFRERFSLFFIIHSFNLITVSNIKKLFTGQDEGRIWHKLLINKWECMHSHAYINTMHMCIWMQTYPWKHKSFNSQARVSSFETLHFKKWSMLSAYFRIVLFLPMWLWDHVLRSHWIHWLLWDVLLGTCVNALTLKGHNQNVHVWMISRNCN